MDDEENLIEHKEIMKVMEEQKRWKYLSLMPINLRIQKGNCSYAEYAVTYFKEREREWELFTDDQKAIEPKFCWENKKTGEKKPVYKKPIENRDQWKNISYVKHSGFQVRRVAWDRPSHTLTERGLQVGTAAHLHPGQHRGFTSIEAKRIMSLPNDYKLLGDLNKRLARVGLMVAPKQMEHLARSINEKVLLPYKEKINA